MGLLGWLVMVRCEAGAAAGEDQDQGRRLPPGLLAVNIFDFDIVERMSLTQHYFLSFLVFDSYWLALCLVEAPSR